MRTDHGLMFLGPEAEFSDINDELPQLCEPDEAQPPPPRDTDAELQLLIRWAQEIDAPRSGGWLKALGTACESER